MPFGPTGSSWGLHPCLLPCNVCHGHALLSNKCPVFDISDKELRNCDDAAAPIYHEYQPPSFSFSPKDNINKSNEVHEWPQFRLPLSLQCLLRRLHHDESDAEICQHRQPGLHQYLLEDRLHATQRTFHPIPGVKAYEGSLQKSQTFLIFQVCKCTTQTRSPGRAQTCQSAPCLLCF